jgi:FlaA1/EpsC-like NDP-sugar epimerase
VLSLFVIILIRFVYRYLTTGTWNLKVSLTKRYAIIGDDKEAVRVAQLLRTTDAQTEFIGLVEEGKRETTNPNFIGISSQIKEIIKIYKINEVIFCAKTLSQQKIISMMAELQSTNIHFIIAPPETDFIIGSNTINTPTDLYVVSVNSISNEDSKRKKRLLDISLSIFVLTFSPIIVFFLKEPFGLWRNIFLIIFAKRTWVGYSNQNLNNNNILPAIKKGIICTKDSLNNEKLDQSTLNRLDLLYARNYSWQSDINIFFKAFRNIGRK